MDHSTFAPQLMNIIMRTRELPGFSLGSLLSSLFFLDFLRRLFTTNGPICKARTTAAEQEELCVCAVNVCTACVHYTHVYTCVGGLKRDIWNLTHLKRSFVWFARSKQVSFSQHGTQDSSEDSNEHSSPKVTTHNPLVRYHPQAATVMGSMAVKLPPSLSLYLGANRPSPMASQYHSMSTAS